MARWVIEGFRGAQRTYHREVSVGHFTDDSIRRLLQTLVAQSGGLTADEVVGALARRRTRIATTLLEVTRDNNGGVYSCGTDPFFTARVVR